MISVVARPNPFDPGLRRIIQIPGGSTIRSALRAAALGERLPVVAGVDGDWWLRSRWDEPIPDGAVVHACAMVAGGGSGDSAMWISIAEIAAGAVMEAFTYGTSTSGYVLISMGIIGLTSPLLFGGRTPGLPSSLSGESGSPTYALDMQNRKRMGEPIPVLYGRHRLVPDLAAAPYVEYVSDDQYLFQLLCLGCGDFTIGDMRIADSPLDRLSNLTYEIVRPGRALTLFRDSVTTSTIVQGQTLRPTNEVVKPGNGTVSIALVGGHWRVTSNVGGIFAGWILGDHLVLSNCSNAGTYNVATVDGSGLWVEVTATLSTENPKAAGVARFAAVVIPAGDVTFNSGTGTVSDPTKKRFAGWKPGDQVTFSNTAANNATYTALSVAGDGSSITVLEAVASESGANPTLTLASGGYVGPFPVNAPNTILNSIGVDIICPKGLTNNNTVYSITVQIDARQIDEDGAPVGGWVTLATEGITRNSFAPVRISFEYDNPFGTARAEVRVKRTSAGQNSINVLEDCVWAGLRGYFPNVSTYEGVTLLAIRVRASEQIPADVARQINVIATRQLPIWNGSTWSDPTETRNPAWALADVLRNTVYGAGLPDSRIDLDRLLELAAVWDDREDWFDGVFDQTDTVWDAMQRIARVGRAIPIIEGEHITFVRDQVRTLRTALYTPAHMVKGSFGIDYSFKKEGDADGVEVAFIDPTTWQQAHLTVTVGDAEPLRPAQVDLFGITDVDHALREATYLARADAMQRKVVHFSTELDGHIPSVGDLITVTHDVAQWGQSGHVIGFDDDLILLLEDGSGAILTEDGDPIGGGARWLVTTTEPLVFTEGATHYLALRRPNGGLDGPFTVTAVDGDDHACILETDPDFDPRTDFALGDRTAYTFGPVTNWALDIVVVKLSPRDETTVEVAGQPYDERLYAKGT